jgi:hypothetical protein
MMVRRDDKGRAVIVSPCGGCNRVRAGINRAADFARLPRPLRLPMLKPATPKGRKP